MEDKFKNADLPAGPERPLTLTSIANAIVGSAIIGKSTKDDGRFLQGPFGHDAPADTIDNATEALSAYF